MNAAAPRPAPDYYDHTLGTQAVRLYPADYAVSDRDLAITTVLGSCVAACLYDPALGLGGMNHFMLPGGASGDETSARYGMHAMELLINDLLKRGARRQRLQAKVFGGANVLSGFSTPIGTRNADFVIEYLRAEGIPMLAQDLGDIHPRKVAFFVQSGRTMVKRLPATRRDVIVDAERTLYGELARTPASGSVELF